MPRGLKVLLGIVLAFGLLSAVGHFMPTPQLKPRNQEIEEGCRKQFGSEGEDAVMRCRTQIMVEEYQQREAEKLKRAAE